MATAFELYGPASFAPASGARVAFPFVSIEESHENRVVPHKRKGRPGARLENTGAEAKTFTFSVEHYNSDFHEDGIDGTTQYPDGVNALTACFEQSETGDLFVPTKGRIYRCQAARYRRTETRTQGVDVAVCQYVFIEDNEDDASAAAGVLPSAASVAQRYIVDAVDLAELEGANLGDHTDLLAFAAELEALANEPGDFVQSIEAKANAIANRIERIEAAYTDAAREGTAESARLLTDPASTHAGRALRRALDVVRRSPATKAPRTVERSFSVPLSIFDVATLTSSSTGDLIKMNAQLADVLEIPPGTPVRVPG